MLKLMTLIAVIAAAAVAATAYTVPSSSSIDRADCPGKIVCPLTGELVCKDRCPLGKPQNEEQTLLPDCCRTSA